MLDYVYADVNGYFRASMTDVSFRIKLAKFPFRIIFIWKWNSPLSLLKSKRAIESHLLKKIEKDKKLQIVAWISSYLESRPLTRNCLPNS